MIVIFNHDSKLLKLYLKYIGDIWYTYLVDMYIYEIYMVNGSFMLSKTKCVVWCMRAANDYDSKISYDDYKTIHTLVTTPS
jgi:hypothetical protein